MVGPLYALTKKYPVYIHGRLHATKPLRGLYRKILASPPMLAYPDFYVPFILETETSVSGLGLIY